MESHDFFRLTRRLGLIQLLLLLILQTAFARSATWSLNPTSNDWNTAENWTPPTIPNPEADTATFGPSNTINLTIGEWSDGSENTVTRVGKVVFAEGAGAYTITVTPVFDVVLSSILTFNGVGITNNSGVVQNFVTANSGTYKAFMDL